MRLYKHQNGIYYVSLPGNIRKSLCTKNEREAQAKYKQLQRLALSNKLVALDNVANNNFSTFTSNFLNTKLDLHPTTLNYYKKAFRKFALFMGSDSFPIKSITDDTINSFKKWCLDQNLRKSSINTYLTYIKTLLKSADSETKISKFRIPKHLPRVLTIDEIDLVLSMCVPDMRCIVQFALYTGCRLSEILGLQWQHITNDVATVTGKFNKQRTVPLVKGAIDAMGTPKSTGYVFRQFTYFTVSRYFKATARAVGIEDVHFHNLRHTSATQMLACGMSLPVLQKILGHEEITTTFIYAKIMDHIKFAEMQKLDFPDLDVDF